MLGTYHKNRWQPYVFKLTVANAQELAAKHKPLQLFTLRFISRDQTGPMALIGGYWEQCEFTDFKDGDHGCRTVLELIKKINEAA